MHDRAIRPLQFLALQLVGAVAVVHLAVGTEQLAAVAANGLLGRYLTSEVFTHPRALLFVLLGVAGLAGIVAAAKGWLPRRRAYELGIALMLCSLLSWVAWHTLLNHGAAIGAAPAPEDHTHGGLLATLFSHYVEPILAALGTAASDTPGSGRVLLGVVSKTLELAAVVVLALLLRTDPAVAGEPLLSLGLSNPEA
ncbi:hypothetical protein [Natronomonas sp. EA1]|uniref:hypothetical protein n=1 Tax=Natronomonas sp. EA1 TaxID=3421655 RepID=UPI003EBBC0B1